MLFTVSYMCVIHTGLSSFPFTVTAIIIQKQNPLVSVLTKLWLFQWISLCVLGSAKPHSRQCESAFLKQVLHLVLSLVNEKMGEGGKRELLALKTGASR